MCYVHFLSQRTLELAPFPAAPWLLIVSSMQNVGKEETISF